MGAPKILCITRTVICEKFKVNGSLARSLIRELAAKGEIKRVGDSHGKFDLYSGAKAKSALQKEAEELAAAKEKEAKQKKWATVLKICCEAESFSKSIAPK